MTNEEKDKIRTAVYDQWRLRVIEEEQAKLALFDPIVLGSNVARALETYKDEIDADISEAIEAAETRRGWSRP